ncbi:collagen alpha-1(I) chain-like [Corvus hawaiiensis]|uniref:collagen alpha-1(I) chain-like n=1 Tax=Corvus hawaiiensis TaxID=134902 RepID=UPI002019043C|nr:collagen alpha-1(I) chain-like [Corvus hawaiiensis]
MAPEARRRRQRGAPHHSRLTATRLPGANATKFNTTKTSTQSPELFFGYDTALETRAVPGAQERNKKKEKASLDHRPQTALPHKEASSAVSSPAHSAINNPSTTGRHQASRRGRPRGRRRGGRPSPIPKGLGGCPGMGMPALPAGPPGRAGSGSPGRASARPREHRGAAPPPARGRRAPSGAGAGTAPRTARLKHGPCPPRPAARSHPRRRRRRRRGRARPHLPAQLGERRPRPVGHGASPAAHPQHSGPAGAAGIPGTRSEGEEGRGALSFPRPAGLSGRSGRPGGGKGGGREQREGRKGRRRRRQRRTKPATGGCLEAAAAMAGKGRSEGSAARERRPCSWGSGPAAVIARFHYCCWKCPVPSAASDERGGSTVLLSTLCSSIQRNGQKVKVNTSSPGVKKMLIKALALRVSACRETRTDGYFLNTCCCGSLLKHLQSLQPLESPCRVRFTLKDCGPWEGTGWSRGKESLLDKHCWGIPLAKQSQGSLLYLPVAFYSSGSLPLSPSIKHDYIRGFSWHSDNSRRQIVTNINSALKSGNQYVRGSMVELWNQYKLYHYKTRNTTNGIRHFNNIYIMYL